ncbi:hypothetical protein [Actinoplanes sp. NPDC051859]|uniref:hypothetical protein n=1 Tax=Actinoplanes sp. NPDC051859 TaxID=3363909 RepID=UPI0037B4C1FD
MNRRIALPLTVAALLLGGGATAAVIVMGADKPATAQTTPVAATASVASSGAPSIMPSVAAEAGPEERFLAATAAHLCEVQSTVYTDAKELAAAYAKKPTYSGVSAADVKTLTKKLNSDSEFSAQLTQLMATSCKPAAKSTS